MKACHDTARPMLCPFHDGAPTLDLFLAELAPQDAELFDAALDLRSLFTAREDAQTCLQQLFRVRRLLAGRHYLAFYRVRRWAHRVIQMEVRAGRGAPWHRRELPLNCARIDEAINTGLASLAEDDVFPAGAHVRFVFAPADDAASAVAPARHQAVQA